MKLIIGVRLLSEWHARHGLEAPIDGTPKSRFLGIHLERRYPALKNIIHYLAAKGSVPLVRSAPVIRRVKGEACIEREADYRLYLCEIETDLPVAYWQSAREVELLIEQPVFERFVSSIRGKAGIAYVDACERFADSIWVAGDGFSGYTPPSSASKTAVSA